MSGDVAGQPGRWQRFTAALPMRTALLAVAAVWVLGCVWSFHEQTAFAATKGFAFPHLLPLVIDGFAVSMAGVAWAASLDARPAVAARLATLVAVAGSAASNGVWAWLRSGHDVVTVVLAVSVPVAANLAFEVLLAELRRQVQRRRGLAAPVALPSPRAIRLVLAPVETFRAWRSLVLDLTELTAPPATGADDAPALPGPQVSPARREPAALDAPPREAAGWPARVGPAEAGSGDARVAELVALLKEGQALTGPQAAARFGVSDRTGRRLVAAAQGVLDTPGTGRAGGPARGGRLTLLDVAGGA